MNIYEALAAINKAVVPIKKDKKNQQQGFNYRGIDQVMNDLHDLFATNEVIITSEILNTSREERVNAKGTTLIWSIIDYRFTFTAIDGTAIQTTARGEAMDSGDKGSNKCYSVALKYVLFGMFLIPTEAMEEPDASTHIVEKKLPELTHPSEAFNKCKAALKNGYSVEQIKQKYSISKEVEHLLTTE